jgi:tRNA 2-thiouridine synthesizing protein A
LTQEVYAMERQTGVIDLRGKSCPVDIIKAKWVLERCRPGATMKILATDPEFPKSLEAFCRQTGASIVDAHASKSESAFVVRKGGRERLVA